MSKGDGSGRLSGARAHGNRPVPCFARSVAISMGSTPVFAMSASRRAPLGRIRQSLALGRGVPSASGSESR
jgi:hypothetical protein